MISLLCVKVMTGLLLFALFVASVCAQTQPGNDSILENMEEYTALVDLIASLRAC
jgi:hypothetical protein